MSAAPPFLSIRERWQRHASAVAKLPAGVQGLAQLMFFAGFSDGMEACIETGQYDEDTAMQLLQALHSENGAMAATALEVLLDMHGGPTQ